MLDINFIRDNQELVKKAFEKRKVKVNLDQLLELDQLRRELIQKVEKLRKERNLLSKKGRGVDISKARDIKKELASVEPKLKATRERFQKIMLSLPNLPALDVPEGESEKDNQVIRKWGSPRKFDFSAQDHLTLGKTLDIIDLERGAKVSGLGFYYLKNQGALLELALIQYAIAKVCDKGFQFFILPDLVKEKAMMGTGFFPAEENEIYAINKDKLYLSGTAEVGLASYHSDEILEGEQLPLYLAAFSTCFRREAGTYGRAARGVFRVHQFNKVEMFVICRREDSAREHEKLMAISEEMMKELELPYEVTLNCLGDLGYPNKRRYDLNAWMPSWQEFRETHSASWDGDFQARRLNIRYRTKKGTLEFCHTLNNTAIASPRIMVAILENYQESDGSIKIPQVLHSYLDFKEIRLKS